MRCALCVLCAALTAEVGRIIEGTVVRGNNTILVGAAVDQRAHLCNTKKNNDMSNAKHFILENHEIKALHNTNQASGQ